jgi:hypothetical protein
MLTKVERPPADAADSFFGESDALDGPRLPSIPVYARNGEVQGAPAWAPGAAPQPYQVPAPPSSSLVPAGVPKGGPSLLMLMAVGGGALLLGAIIVIVMLAR